MFPRRQLLYAIAAALELPAQGQQALAQATDAAGAGLPQSAEVALATVYAAELEGQCNASGKSYSADGLTAAHCSYPLGTKLRIIATQSDKPVTVRVNDRSPCGAGRIVNLSSRAAQELGFGSSGTLQVRLEVIELGPNISTGPEAPAARVSSDVTVVDDSQASTGRSVECARQAKILGLKNDWAARDVRTCLAIRGEERVKWTTKGYYFKVKSLCRRNSCFPRSRE